VSWAFERKNTMSNVKSAADIAKAEQAAAAAASYADQFAAIFDKNEALRAAFQPALVVELAKRLAERLVTDEHFAKQFLAKTGNDPKMKALLDSIPRIA
jgi:hypothetical protein